MKKQSSERETRRTREEIQMDKEDAQCDRMCEIAMRGIASFYRDDRRALKLLREFAAKSPSKFAARDAILLRAKLELATFRIRKERGLPLREQDVKILERALFQR